ncbi:hypothetical protein GN244_ATG09175 [Phytophthora infestans]|uniref:Uncharacterized protein n=1 Tax=Phytophthora infestans TaxID=4787 RepID=A0A833T7C5_PHYIN|nr:hypothetical protein GN244_ATG09175 [Phytophthora infestans]
MQSENEELALAETSVLAFLAEYEQTERVRKKQAWSQRQKEEVNRMRKVINRLSVRLHELKNAAKVQRAGSQINALTVKRQLVKTSGMLMWKRIAERQYLLRRDSEIENIKLRNAVRSQFRQAKSFQRMFKKRIPEDAVASLSNLISATTRLEPDLLYEAQYTSS